MPNLAEYLRLIGQGVGIGDKPEGGEGQLLVRGEKNWGNDLTPADYML